MYRTGSNLVAEERVEHGNEGQQILRHIFTTAPHVFAPAKSILLHPGEKPTQLLRMYSGWAVREVPVPPNQRALLAIYIQGDFLGLEGIVSSKTRDKIVAQTDMSYQAVPMTTIWQLIEQNPSCSYRMLDLFAREKEMVDDLAISLSRCSAEIRIAAFLIRIYDRLRGKQITAQRSFKLPLTQQDIGDHLGLTMVHVNRVLKELRTQGAVLVRHQTVLILDVKLLRCIASGDEKLVTVEDDGHFNLENMREPQLLEMKT